MSSVYVYKASKGHTTYDLTLNKLGEEFYARPNIILPKVKTLVVFYNGVCLYTYKCKNRKT